jgi:hypothetical protein
MADCWRAQDRWPEVSWIASTDVDQSTGDGVARNEDGPGLRDSVRIARGPRRARRAWAGRRPRSRRAAPTKRRDRSRGDDVAQRRSSSPAHLALAGPGEVRFSQNRGDLVAGSGIDMLDMANTSSRASPPHPPHPPPPWAPGSPTGATVTSPELLSGSAHAPAVRSPTREVLGSSWPVAGSVPVRWRGCFRGLQPHWGTCTWGTTWVRSGSGFADQDSYDAIYCVVDLHAMTLPYERRARRPDRRTAMLLLAAGLDPSGARSSCRATCRAHRAHVDPQLRRDLRRARPHDAVQGEGPGRTGVGERRAVRLPGADGRRHPRVRHRPRPRRRRPAPAPRAGADVAIRFNHRFGDTLVVPEAAIPPVGARIMDLQKPTAKMSKSADSPRARCRCSTTRAIDQAHQERGHRLRDRGAVRPAGSRACRICSQILAAASADRFPESRRHTRAAATAG